MRALVSSEREREITEAYGRAYATVPQETWFADASTHAAGELLERARRTSDTPVPGSIARVPSGSKPWRA